MNHKTARKSSSCEQPTNNLQIELNELIKQLIV